MQIRDFKGVCNNCTQISLRADKLAKIAGMTDILKLLDFLQYKYNYQKCKAVWTKKTPTKPMKYEQISECFISVTLIIEIVEKKEWVILV